MRTALIVKGTIPFLYKGLESSEMQATLSANLHFPGFFHFPMMQKGESSKWLPIRVNLSA